MAETQTIGNSDKLSFTLFLAAAIHAFLIFGITFSSSSNDEPSQVLNVTLATHKSKTAPEDADFIAQFNQQASGTEQDAKELTTDTLAEIDALTIQDANQPQAKKNTPLKETLVSAISTTQQSDRKTVKKSLQISLTTTQASK